MNIQTVESSSTEGECDDSDEEREKNTKLFSAIKNGNLQKVQELLKAGVDANIIDKNNKNNTPLHYAVEREQKEIVKELILQEWKTDVKNNNGDTSLHIAVSKGNEELVKLLLHNKTEVTIKNNNGKSPLDIAKHLKGQNIVKILKLHQQAEQKHSVSKQFSNKTKKDQTKQRSQRRSGTTGSGELYEIDLLVLCKIRGERNTDRFYLDTNVLGVGCFDDLVFRYWKNEKSTIILLQAKHVENFNKNKITIEKFMNSKRDKFYLCKYFSDYLNSRAKFNNKSKDPFFEGNFKELDIKYIIYTNAVLDENFDEDRITNIGRGFLSTNCNEDKDHAFKFNLNDKNSDVIGMLENFSCQQRVKLLAHAVVSCISGELNFKNMMGNDFISTYHVFLAKNVFEVEKETIENEKGKYREGKINSSFLNIDNEDVLMKVLKEEVLYEYAKNVVFKNTTSLELGEDPLNLIDGIAESLKNNNNVKEDVIKKLGGSIIILDTKDKMLKFAQEKKMNENGKQFLMELEKKLCNLADYRFQIPHKFVKEKLEEQAKQLKFHVRFGNINPRFKKPEHLINKLIKLFNEYNSEKVITINGPTEILTNGDIKNMGQLVGNVLLWDENGKMLRLACEGRADALDFIKNLRITAKSEHLEVDDYKFDVKVKNFPRETLFTDDEDKSNVKDFFDKLEICTGQASHKEMENIIKRELINSYKFTKEEAEESYPKIKLKGEKHWEEGNHYLEKDDDFFPNIVKLNILYDVEKPSALFTGRTTELKKICELLQEDGAVRSQIACLSGLGGMGKTELARKYAKVWLESMNPCNIICINANDRETLINSFTRLAKDKLGISTEDANRKEKDTKSIVEEIYEFLNKRETLFIFDNAEYNEDLFSFLPCKYLTPDSTKPYILFTSRNQEWDNIDVIVLKELKLDDAIEFVKTGLSIQDEFEDKTIIALVEKLQCFPLAIQQAISYIKHQRVTGIFTINDYLDEYEKKTKDLLDSEIFKGIDNDYTKTTFTTWKITIEKIGSDEKHGWLALAILNTIAFFGPECINRKIFLKFAGRDESKLKSAVRLLVKYSMINGEEMQSNLSVHRLVQKVRRINLKGREKQILWKALPLFEAYNVGIGHARVNYVDHAISVWNAATKHEELVTNFWFLPVIIVKELNATRRYQEAYLFGSVSLTLLNCSLGDMHLSVIFMMENVAEAIFKYLCLDPKKSIKKEKENYNEAEALEKIHKSIVYPDDVVPLEKRLMNDAVEMFEIACNRKEVLFGPGYQRFQCWHPFESLWGLSREVDVGKIHQNNQQETHDVNISDEEPLLEC